LDGDLTNKVKYRRISVGLVIRFAAYASSAILAIFKL
jgi:hypothetical protein